MQRTKLKVFLSYPSSHRARVPSRAHVRRRVRARPKSAPPTKISPPPPARRASPHLPFTISRARLHDDGDDGGDERDRHRVRHALSSPNEHPAAQRAPERRRREVVRRERASRARALIARVRARVFHRSPRYGERVYALRDVLSRARLRSRPRRRANARARRPSQRIVLLGDSRRRRITVGCESRDDVYLSPIARARARYFITHRSTVRRRRHRSHHRRRRALTPERRNGERAIDRHNRASRVRGRSRSRDARVRGRFKSHVII